MFFPYGFHVAINLAPAGTRIILMKDFMNKRLHTSLRLLAMAGLVVLAGCAGKGESGGQSSAARLDGKEKGSEFLAYEHNVS
ncbi:MAG: hypothetical protein RSE46_17225, partial [Janthinobacterium sp.]